LRIHFLFQHPHNKQAYSNFEANCWCDHKPHEENDEAIHEYHCYIFIACFESFNLVNHNSSPLRIRNKL
jgi:hypothetical protein